MEKSQSKKSNSPFAAPSEFSGVPLSFGSRVGREQEAEAVPASQAGSRAPGDFTVVRPNDSTCPRSVQVPFPYAKRCIVYSVVLILNIAGCAFSIAMLCSVVYMSVRITQQVGGASTGTTVTKNVVALSLNRDPFELVCQGYGNSLEDELNATMTESRGAICVPGPAGAQLDGVFTIMSLVFSVLLVAISSVMLGVMRCQRRRARRVAANDDAQMEHQQVQDQVQNVRVQAAAMGRPLYVVVEGARAPLPVEAFNAALVSSTTAATVRLAERTEYDANVRYGFGVTALLFSCLCLVFTFISLMAGVGAENEVKRMANAANKVVGDTRTWTSHSKAIDSASVWPNVPSLFLYLATTVLLALPSCSGIKDNKQGLAAKAEAVAAVQREEEMQIHIHEVEVEAVPREGADAGDDHSEGMQFSEESFFSPDLKKEKNLA